MHEVERQRDTESDVIRTIRGDIAMHLIPYSNFSEQVMSEDSNLKSKKVTLYSETRTL